MAWPHTAAHVASARFAAIPLTRAVQRERLPVAATGPWAGRPGIRDVRPRPLLLLLPCGPLPLPPLLLAVAGGSPGETALVQAAAEASPVTSPTSASSSSSSSSCSPRDTAARERPGRPSSLRACSSSRASGLLHSARTPHRQNAARSTDTATEAARVTPISCWACWSPVGASCPCPSAATSGRWDDDGSGPTERHGPTQGRVSAGKADEAGGGGGESILDGLDEEEARRVA